MTVDAIQTVPRPQEIVQAGSENFSSQEKESRNIEEDGSRTSFP